MKRSRNERMFDRLCHKLGICLHAVQIQRILDALPPDPETMVDAVLREEGFEHPEYLDKPLRRAVRQIIAANWPLD